MTDDLYIGVDPGLKGGIAFISEEDRIVDVFPMPIVGGVVNIPLLVSKIHHFAEKYTIFCATVEKVHSMPKQGVASTFRFGMGYGQILGMFATLRIPVLFVTPQRWKKEMLRDTKKDKAAACEMVVRTYPSTQLVLPRCRKPHDGMADAILICNYGRL